MSHPFWVVCFCRLFIWTLAVEHWNQIFPVCYFNDLIGFTMNYQQLSTMLNYLFFVVKMLLYYAPHTSDNLGRHIFYRIEWRHQNEGWDTSMTSQISGSSATYWPAHYVNIFTRAIIVEEKVIEGQRIFFDGVWNKRSPAGFIIAVWRILDGVESNIEFPHYRFNEISDQSDIFSVAMEVDEASFWLPTFLGWNLDVRYLFAVLNRCAFTRRNLRIIILTSLYDRHVTPRSYEGLGEGKITQLHSQQATSQRQQARILAIDFPKHLKHPLILLNIINVWTYIIHLYHDFLPTFEIR